MHFAEEQPVVQACKGIKKDFNEQMKNR